jgi:hypothetical protein
MLSLRQFIAETDIRTLGGLYAICQVPQMFWIFGTAPFGSHWPLWSLRVAPFEVEREKAVNILIHNASIGSRDDGVHYD